MDQVTTCARLQCPYCAEVLEIWLEADLDGELVQDCEVCCNPWLVRIDRRDGVVRVEARRLDE